MGPLERMERRLQQKVEHQAEEVDKDVDFALEFLEENPEVNSVATNLTTSSLPVKILKGFLGVSTVYILWTNLSFNQFLGVVYLFVGFLTARVSDYGKMDWKYWFTAVFYLPVVVYGLLPDQLRIDK